MSTPSIHGRSRLATRIGLLMLVAANAILPLTYTRPSFAMALDHLSVLALAFWTAGLAWRRAHAEGPAAFHLLGLGAALGGLRYLPSVLMHPRASLLGPAISISALLLLGLGFLRWPLRVRMPRERLRTTLDGLAITLAMFTAAWVALGSAEGVGRVPRGMMLVYAVQISISIGILALWLLQETHLGKPGEDRARGFVRWALVALVAHSALTALLRVTGHYQLGYLGHGVEALHQVATLLIALAALSPAPGEDLRSSVPPVSFWRALIPSAVSLAVLMLVAFRIAHPQGQAPGPLMALFLALLGILLLRHGLLILDLERLSHSLEIRVAERTRELEQHHHQDLADLRVRMMAGLAAGLAHDLNNLLSIIRLRVDLLQETAEARQQPDLKVLVETSERAAVMTRRILASSRMQELHPAAFDATEWLLSRRSLFQALLHPAQALEMEVAGGLQVLVDSPSLDQILQNLLTNARDAMGPGGTLRIRAGSRDHGVRLEVQDDGPGIPPEHLSRMFEPFFTTKAHGTGLGLATVRNLVVQNRGAIHIESTVGAGTTFQIDLPAPERLLLA